MQSFPGPLFMARLRTLFKNLDKLLAVTAEGSSDDAQKLAGHLTAVRIRIDGLEKDLNEREFDGDFSSNRRGAGKNEEVVYCPY